MEPLSTLNILRAADLAVMMVFYSLEPKSRTYTLLFGLTCIGSSSYGFLSGTWHTGSEAYLCGVLLKILLRQREDIQAIQDHKKIHHAKIQPGNRQKVKLSGGTRLFFISQFHIFSHCD